MAPTDAAVCAVVLLVVLLLATSDAAGAHDNPGEYLYAQNAIRASLGIGPLSWSDKLAAYAQRYADRRRGDCGLIHSDGPYGENLFEGSWGYTAAYAVEDWISEQRYYDYGSNSCAGGQMCGHYTQVVWAGTKYVGCARVRCADGDVFVTCNYDPPGNVIGERPY